MGEKEIELEQENIIVYSGGGAVNSVNGYTGDVVLTTSDLENTSDYQTGDEVDAAIATAIAGKQDTLTAGANITIDGTTISATDTTYTAGTNVSISAQNVISATDTTYTAGTNVSISDQNVISATNTTYTAGTGLDLTGTIFSVDTDTIATKQSVTDEATARENADIGLQGQIDAISASSDVTDIVGTYAALQAYDTTHLKDNDIIKVLQDESQNDETTYYRWSTTTETFTLIGEEGPYYTKAATDTLLAAKQDTLTAGANIAIEEESGTGDLVISATDTTYSNFIGTDGTAAGTAGLVPAPATTDAGKYLKADGTWDTVSAGPTVVQTTGTSTTDVMSQNAVTSMVFADPATQYKIKIGAGTSTSEGTNAVEIGHSASANGQNSIAIGNTATANTGSSISIGQNVIAGSSSSVAIGNTANIKNSTASNSVAIGIGAKASNYGAIALGAYSGGDSMVQGEMNIGTSATFLGYNNSNYRLLAGLYDPQSAHDAATKGYVDGTDEAITIATSDWSALSSSDPYDYSATVTLTATITANSTIELLNDQAVLFATNGFAIGSADTVNNTITIYSIGQPSASVTLNVNIK